MKKSYTSFIALLALVVGTVGMARAEDPALRALGVQEMSYRGATHAITLAPEHFSEATLAASQTNTFTLSGPATWQFAGAEVITPFDSASLTNTLTLGLTFLAGSDTLVNGIEAAKDTWRPYRFIAPAAITVATTGPSTNELTSTVSSPSCGTVTNGGSVVFTLISAPASTLTLNKLDSGSAAFYLRIWR